MAYRYTDSDDRDGFDRDYMKVWITTALKNGATKKQIEEGAWVANTSANRDKLIQAVQKLQDVRCIEELARIFIDYSFYYYDGKYYQYGTDDGKQLYEGTVYGG